jgi:hypothetical protein
VSAANFDSYDQGRQAEDVEDIIYNVSPVDNPVCAMSRTIRATGKLHEWTEDVLQAATKNAAIDGADAGNDQSNAVSELNNQCQIFTKVARVSGTLEEVDKYGRDSEMAYQLELRYGELANDEELTVVGGPLATAAGQIAVVGDSTTAREMAAVQIQLTNGRNGGSLVLTSAATTTALLEAELLVQHEACYDLGGNPGYLVVPPTVARFISAFAAASGRERDFGTGRAVVNVVDLYVSPYGELDVVLDRHAMRSSQDGNVNTDGNSLFGLDFQYLATPVLRATRDFPLARTGDAENREIIRESTCAALNTDAHFLIESIDDTLT